VVVQKSRMPILVNATTPAKPVTSTATTRTQPSPLAPASGAVSSTVDSSANFATKPGRGGSPLTSSTQQTNISPRNAIAAGIAAPISPSVPYGSGVFTPKAM